jgi:hypothetical protein
MREEFLWLVFDSIQTQPEQINDATSIASRLMGATFVLKNGKSLNRHFEVVCSDALGCLKVSGLIYAEPRFGYRATKKQTKEQFLEAFEKVFFEGEKQC